MLFSFGDLYDVMMWKAIFFALILLSSVSVIPLTFAIIHVPPVGTLPSPKKQVEQGVSADNVTCNNGLVLMKKLSDGSPACVKEQTMKKLIERGWGGRECFNNYLAINQL